MGALATAIQNIHFERHHTEDLLLTSAAMQGCRFEMEDAHSIITSLPNHPGTTFVGVYDGHSGHDASRHLQDNLHIELDKLDALTPPNITALLEKLDISFGHSEKSTQGSTIVAALIEKIENTKPKKYNIQIFWVGDSRAIGNNRGKFMSLTVDHKPSNPSESTRILEAGGTVSVDNRVDGELAMSRAFGDWNLKNKHLKYNNMKVICVPEFQSVVLQEGDWLLISCDGLTESLTDKNIGDTCGKALLETPDDPDVVLTKLLDAAVKSNSRDNMSSVLVQFRNGLQFAKRDENRKRTFQPGPVFKMLKNRQFMNAWTRNCQAVGYVDPQNCTSLMRAAYEFEANRMSDEKKLKEIRQAMELIPQLNESPTEIQLEVAPRTKYSQDVQFILKMEKPGWKEASEKSGLGNILSVLSGNQAEGESRIDEKKTEEEGVVIRKRGSILRTDQRKPQA